VKVPFTPGRMDASQEQTDVESFAPLEPVADGFRNYLGKASISSCCRRGAAGRPGAAADADRARDDGARRRPARARRQRRAVQARRLHRRSRDADQRLLRQPARHGHEWEAASTTDVFEGRDRKTGAVKWTGTRVDLVFGSNSQLRALAEVYASDDAKEKFVKDFVAAWTKVMNLDRFDRAGVRHGTRPGGPPRTSPRAVSPRPGSRSVRRHGRRRRGRGRGPVRGGAGPGRSGPSGRRGRGRGSRRGGRGPRGGSSSRRGRRG
jgi:hypothetical protein